MASFSKSYKWQFRSFSNPGLAVLRILVFVFLSRNWLRFSEASVSRIGHFRKSRSIRFVGSRCVGFSFLCDLFATSARFFWIRFCEKSDFRFKGACWMSRREPFKKRWGSVEVNWRTRTAKYVYFSECYRGLCDTELSRWSAFVGSRFTSSAGILYLLFGVCVRCVESKFHSLMVIHITRYRKITWLSTIRFLPKKRCQSGAMLQFVDTPKHKSIGGWVYFSSFSRNRPSVSTP